MKPCDKPDKDGYFDEPVAARYDESSAFAPEVVDPTVDFLAHLAADGPALEFGIGTGRIAIPLAERGVPVHGIDLSAAMTERLHAKPGGELLDVEIGDFASTTVEGSFALVYLVFNTIQNLTSQEAQLGCFRNAAAHLQPGGHFVIEVGIPQLQQLPPGETVHTYRWKKPGWISTSTTSRTRVSSPTTSDSKTANGNAGPFHSAMSGHQNST